jgi:hypothetical protein
MRESVDGTAQAPTSALLTATLPRLSHLLAVDSIEALSEHELNVWRAPPGTLVVDQTALTAYVAPGTRTRGGGCVCVFVYVCVRAR